MPLIQAHRRYLGVVIVALLVLVMFASLIPDPMGPPHPFTLDAGKTAFIDRANALSRALRNYVSDNFGYGRSLPYLRDVIGNAFCRATAKLSGQRHVGWPVWSAGGRA